MTFYYHINAPFICHIMNLAFIHLDVAMVLAFIQAMDHNHYFNLQSYFSYSVLSKCLSLSFIIVHVLSFGSLNSIIATFISHYTLTITVITYFLLNSS
jgi:hypothetical protein